MFKYSLCLGLFLLAGTFVFGQSDSLEVHQIKGKPYYIHVVKKGESLYAIHKKYDVPIDVIKKENPGVLDGLSIDEKVYIPVKRNEDQPATVDGNYIQHTVLKKQTLYYIAKLYKVDQSEIVAANPELSDGLKEGQVIKIPIKNLKEETKKTEPVANNNETHVVKKGETLYALSRMYDVSVADIKAANNGLTQGLREGETIYLPLKKEKNLVLGGIREKVDSLIRQDTVKRKPIYHVGLFLPFYLDENDEMVEKRTALEEKMIYPRSKFAIEFYKGFSLMLDSLASDSVTFKLFVYDTKGNDTARVQQLLKRTELKSFDLIVGPLYHENFKLMASFAKVNNIALVTPVKQSNKILLGNPAVFKVIPSKTALIEPYAKLLADSFSSDNLIAVEHATAKEKALVNMLIDAYGKRLSFQNDSTRFGNLQKVELTNNFPAILSKLKKDKNNVIFVPSSDQSFVTTFFSQLITTLNDRNYKDCKITLLGLDDWTKFRNIDIDYFQRLNVHYYTSQFIHEDDSLVQLCVQNYIKKTKTYPSKHTMLGCDLADYFGSKLIQSGSLHIPDVEAFKGKSITLDFFKTGIESGYENRAGVILRYFDYNIEPISQ